MGWYYSVETPVYVRGHFRWYGRVWVNPFYRRLPTKTNVKVA